MANGINDKKHFPSMELMKVFCGYPWPRYPWRFLRARMTSCSKWVRPWPSNLSISRTWSRPIIPLTRIQQLPPTKLRLGMRNSLKSIRPLCSSLFTYYVWNPPLIGNFMVTQCFSIRFHNDSYLSRSFSESCPLFDLTLEICIFFWSLTFVRVYWEFDR